MSQRGWDNLAFSIVRETDKIMPRRPRSRFEAVANRVTSMSVKVPIGVFVVIMLLLWGQYFYAKEIEQRCTAAKVDSGGGRLAERVQGREPHARTGLP